MSGEAFIADGLAGLTPDNSGILPDNCPVIALGVDEKGGYWFCNDGGVPMRVSGAGMTSNKIAFELFEGDVGWLQDHFAPRNKNKEEYNSYGCASALVRAAKAAGHFDPKNVRGPGVWWFDDQEWDAEGNPGKIVVHVGDKVAIGAWDLRGRLHLDWTRVGVRLGKYVYKFGPPQIRPSSQTVTAREVQWLKALLGTWAFARGADAVHLTVGLIALGYVPAIPRHRPIFVYEGSTGTGKSTLFRLLVELMGGNAVRKERWTSALVRDVLNTKNSAPMVIINEFEATGDDTSKKGIIEFLRETFTRGEGAWGRGGNDMLDAAPPDLVGVIGAINTPAMDPQDLNRQVALRLMPLHGKLSDYKLNRRMATARKLGPKLFARVLQEIPRYQDVYARFAQGLASKGHSPREVNTWGNALTFADLLCHDRLDPARVDYWMDRLLPLGKDGGGRAAGHIVLQKIMSARVAEWSAGIRRTVMEVVLEAWNHDQPYSVTTDIRRMGIAVTDVSVSKDIKVRYLALSRFHPELDAMFRGTAWANGGWQKALLQLDHPEVVEWHHPINFLKIDNDANGKSSLSRNKAIIVPIEHLGFETADFGAPPAEIADLS